MLSYRPQDRYGWVTGRAARPGWRRHLWWWLPLLLVFDLWLAVRLWPRPEPAEGNPPAVPATLEPGGTGPAAARGRLDFPTGQRRLLDPPDGSVFMLTASGNIESALYGTTRTRGEGGRILPSFHEGIDIAPLRRDRRGTPLDPVLAAGDGRVAYINRHAGNSNYGVYVVLFHDDPVGEIYTLYAHLAHPAADLRVGQPVAAGEPVGVMGYTPSSIVPRARAHLHFEIGLVQNRHFDRWYRAQRRTPDHGNLHGANLSGIDPLAAFAARDADDRFSMADVLATVPVAFELAFPAGRTPDYFERYPALWRGEPPAGDVAVIGVSAHGVVLYGRNAAGTEIDTLDVAPALVVYADAAVLGRNGRRLIVPEAGGWTLTASGREWLEILQY